MIIKHLTEGRSIKDLLSFRSSLRFSLPQQETNVLWIKHILCVKDDFDWFLSKIKRRFNKRVVKNDHFNTLKAKALIINYLEILFFGQEQHMGNTTYTFTKPDTIYDNVDKEVMIEFTSSFYINMCFQNKALTIFLIEAILAYSNKNSSVPPEEDPFDMPPTPKDEDLNDLEKFIEKNKISATMTSVNIKDVINAIKKDFEDAKAFYELISDGSDPKNNTLNKSAGKETGVHEFNEVLNLMEKIDISSFNTSHFKSFSSRLRKWTKSKKQGHSATTHSTPLTATDEFLEILNPELLQFPAYYEDLMAKTLRSAVEYDIYIDISGSTQGTIINLEKRAYVEFFKNKEIRNIYYFENDVYKTSHQNLLRVDTNGGTNINKVIKSIEKKGFPSVVITDAEDMISDYSKNAIFMIFGDYTSNNFVGSAVKFITQKQIMFYDENKKRFQIPKT